MAGGKETPRQKMIGMMYLVLTALLALNISKEVLNGFVKVEKGLIQTQQTLQRKTNDTYEKIKFRNEVEPTRAAPFLKVADEVRAQSDSLQRYIQTLKARTMATSQGTIVEAEANNLKPYLTYENDDVENGFPFCVGLDAKNPDTPEEDLILRKDEYDAVTNMLYGANIATPKEGEWTAVELRGKLEAYRDYLTSVNVTDANGRLVNLDTAVINSVVERFQYPMEMEGEKEVTWEYANFYHNPLAAVMPIMSKLMIDVQDAEYDVLTDLLSKIGGNAATVNQFRGLVMTDKNYVFKGDEITAQVMLAASDNTKLPKMYMSATPWQEGDDVDQSSDAELVVNATTGIADFTASTDDLDYGDYVFRGSIVIEDKNGNPETYNVVTNPITVAQPSAVVSPTKMNIFYSGVPNPVEISASGVAQENLVVRIDRGTISGGRNGQYNVVPPNSGKCKISVSQKMEDGTLKPMGTKEFRSKKLPPPNVTWFRKYSDESASVSAASLNGSSLGPIQATYKTNTTEFDYEIKPSQLKILGFSLTVISSDGDWTGKSDSENMTKEMLNALKVCQSGDKFIFEDIRYEVPSGPGVIGSWKVNVVR